VGCSSVNGPLLCTILVRVCHACQKLISRSQLENEIVCGVVDQLLAGVKWRKFGIAVAHESTDMAWQEVSAILVSHDAPSCIVAVSALKFLQCSLLPLGSQDGRLFISQSKVVPHRFVKPEVLEIDIGKFSGGLCLGDQDHVVAR